VLSWYFPIAGFKNLMLSDCMVNLILLDHEVDLLLNFLKNFLMVGFFSLFFLIARFKFLGVSWLQGWLKISRSHGLKTWCFLITGLTWYFPIAVFEFGVFVLESWLDTYRLWSLNLMFLDCKVYLILPKNTHGEEWKSNLWAWYGCIKKKQRHSKIYRKL
jgi:hypothetical protein